VLIFYNFSFLSFAGPHVKLPGELDSQVKCCYVIIIGIIGQSHSHDHERARYESSCFHKNNVQ